MERNEEHMKKENLWILFLWSSRDNLENVPKTGL